MRSRIVGQVSTLAVTVLLAALLVACIQRTPVAPTPTAEALVTQSGSPTVLESFPYQVWSRPDLSPDEQWIAVSVDVWPKGGPTSAAFAQLKVVQVGGSTEWLLMEQPIPYISGQRGWEPFHWSQDGRYLYFGRWWAPDGCALFLDTADWSQVELSTGHVTEMARSISSAAFSPDGQRMAYIRGSESVLALGIYDVASGVERRFPLDEGVLRAGDILWKPDGMTLVFSVLEHACEPDKERSSIEWVDLATGARTIAISDQPHLLWGESWLPDGRVVLRSNADTQMRWLDLQTGTLTPALSP